MSALSVDFISLLDYIFPIYSYFTPDPIDLTLYRCTIHTGVKRKHIPKALS
jgi:hypothetical protein